MGKKSSDLGISPAESSLSRIAEETYGQTAPGRQQFYKLWKNMMSGQFPAAMETQFSGLRNPIEAQYGVARENVLGTMPKGGGLNQALTDVETSRSQGLSDLATQIFMDQMQKMYGAAFGAPQQSMAGLGSAASAYAGRQGAQIGANASDFASWMKLATSVAPKGPEIPCCFNFLEAEGEIYWTVRLYRDENYSKKGPVSKGYRLTAKYLVPIMARYHWFKILVRITMTRPLKMYFGYCLGENHWGIILWPFKALWINLWKVLGTGVK